MSVHSPCVLVLHENLLKGFLVVAKLAVHSSKFYRSARNGSISPQFQSAAGKEVFYILSQHFPGNVILPATLGRRRFLALGGAQGAAPKALRLNARSRLRKNLWDPRYPPANLHPPPPRKIKKQTKKKKKRSLRKELGSQLGIQSQHFLTH